MREFNNKELEILYKINNIHSGIIIAELRGEKDYFIVFEGYIRRCTSSIFIAFEENEDPNRIKARIKCEYEIESGIKENNAWGTSERFIEVIGYDKLDSIEVVLE